MQIVTILGATGSVGGSTVDVLRHHTDRFKIGAVVGGSNAGALAQLAKSCGATFAALADESRGAELKSELSGSGIASGAGEAAVLEAVERDADIVFAAISGAAGLRPTHAALKPGRKLALANKETLVCAGEAFMAEAKRIGATILPVDSEHNALQQALGAGAIEDVATLILTASGGPFRTWSIERIREASPAEASAHPTYAMGAKINIDSATLMNKGLELIEAHHLFGVGPDRLDVVVHPQSIIHGLVEWRDGALTAGLATPDMRIPIAHCLADGARLATPVRRLDLAAIERLTFEKPDEERFPCLALARMALKQGGAMPTIVNAANEVAVAAFLGGQIGFLDIPRIVAEACESGASKHWQAPSCIDEALALDDEVRRRTKTRLAA
ncbi:MAG: 1-deoxy-D-xylulose 5-phosphate reductoisomerase [uncultured Microvirga sp.]|uniref:1-deoxy-D-xylulose 5-phosphate reductoisomerase n=1 Tax=uncultured Microvirga sp. TaxID=412392 RepID=A0A6J4LRM3_9HYPH|nr:MAG: 1-deoxy-D-xylulose 5-phosphate reductoisomerase [uncultured Microvirga sp.]